jgi:hypothetical protein
LIAKRNPVTRSQRQRGAELRYVQSGRAHRACKIGRELKGKQGISMGEAKHRRMAAEARRAQLSRAVEQVGLALRRLATAASSHLGSDCYLHAELGRHLMADLGFDCKIAVGFAAWRVGRGDADVIAHTLHTAGYLPPGAKGFAYHAWLVVDNCVVNLTTYQIARKARELDAADGGHTTVDWCPDSLILPLRQVRSYDYVAKAPDAGHAYYESHPGLPARMAATFTLDREDLAAARVLLANPEMQVIGPNQISDESGGA